MNTEQPAPLPPIFGWIKDNWEWLSAIVLVIGTLVWAWVKFTIIDRLKAIGSVQRKIIRCIPPDALDKGLLLMPQEMCTTLRNNCANHIVSEELMATMTIMKQAMALVISHNKDIPQDQKDKIMQDLVR